MSGTTHSPYQPKNVHKLKGVSSQFLAASDDIQTLLVNECTDLFLQDNNMEQQDNGTERKFPLI